MNRFLVFVLILGAVVLTGCAHWAASWTGRCPSEMPIKGNADSRYYHLPGDEYYQATRAEFCFGSEAVARRNGYSRAPR